jgi:hypothetical protein
MLAPLTELEFQARFSRHFNFGGPAPLRGALSITRALDVHIFIATIILVVIHILAMVPTTQQSVHLFRYRVQNFDFVA